MTLRELLAAAKAVRMEKWNHTADMMALIASVKCGKPYQRGHFHPYMDRPQPGDTIDPKKEYERIKRREARGQ